MDSEIRIVLFPRYTAVYGTVTLFTPPINVRAFEKAIITAWRGEGIGSTPADVGFHMEQSADLGIWNAGPSFSPASAGGEEIQETAFSLEWARLGATVSGASPGTTVWAVGVFVLRSGQR